MPRAEYDWDGAIEYNRQLGIQQKLEKQIATLTRERDEARIEANGEARRKYALAAERDTLRAQLAEIVAAAGPFMTWASVLDSLPDHHPMDAAHIVKVKHFRRLRHAVAAAGETEPRDAG